MMRKYTVARTSGRSPYAQELRSPEVETADRPQKVDRGSRAGVTPVSVH
jgi:hypothetical protein